MAEQKTERKQVAIIGGGITGLSAAYHLQKAGHCVVIFEKSARTGGVIQTSIKKGFLCEHGPNSLMINDKRVADLIQEVGLDSELLPANSAASKRFIVHRGKLCPLPSSPTSFLSSPLFSFKAKCRLFKEPFVAKRAADAGNESFADFVRRRLGPEMLEKAAGPFVSGIYAGDPNRLSTRYAFPRLFALEQEHGSLLKGMIQVMRERKKNPGNKLSRSAIVSFKNGMESLPRSIEAHLEEGSVFFNTKLDKITFNEQSKRWHIQWESPKGTIGQGSFSDLIITVPTHKLEDLPLDPQLLDAASKLPHLDYPPVATMMLGFKRSQVKHPLDGFGMLNALTEKSKILGALFTSTLFPGRAPEECVAINVMLGGARTPEHARMSESAMKASVMDELRRLLGIEGNPIFTNLERWEKAIPQLNLGYNPVLEQIEQCEKKFPGIHFAGNYRGGISIGDCILNGMHLCEKIST